MYEQDGYHAWYTAPSGTAGNAITFTQAMTLTAAGNLGIGTTSPATKLHLGGSSDQSFEIDGSLTPTFVGTAGSVGQISVNRRPHDGAFADTGKAAAYINLYSEAGSSTITFSTTTINNDNPLERARITSDGNLLVGTTGASLGTNTFFKPAGAGQPVLYLAKNSTANTDQAFCVANGSGGGTVSFQVLANGDAQNTNNSYAAISDVKLKENIVDASPKLADLMKVRVRNYTLKNGESHKQLGVIAQELEQIFPALVSESADRDSEGNDLGTTTKAVKYSVFVPMLIKAIQEQQQIIQSLEQRIAAMEQ
jgi:hypothetical protein